MAGIRSFPFGMAYFQGRTVSFREGGDLSLHIICKHVALFSRPRSAGVKARLCNTGVQLSG